MNKFELVDINSVERNRLIDLGVNPREMKALQATENWDYPDGIHTIASGTRGGLVDRKTNIGWKGWLDEGSVAIDSVINSFVEGDSVIRNSHLDVGRAVHGVTMSNTSAFGADSRIMDSTLEGATIRNSSISGSKVKGSHVTGSQLNTSTVDNSELKDSILDQSYVSNSKGVHHANGKHIAFNTANEYSAADRKFVERGWDMKRSTNAIGYTNDDMTIYVRDDGVTVSMDHYSPAVIPFDMMDLVSEKVNEVTYVKPMSHDERMDQAFAAMCDRAIGFYGDGPNIYHRSESVLEFTNPDNIYDTLHIAREVIDNTGVVRVKHSTEDKTTTRILVEDPEDFRAMYRDDSLMFVKSTAPLNALIRSFNPELAVAVEVEGIEALHGRDLSLNSGDLDDLESPGNTLGG